MKKIHISISVKSLTKSIANYNQIFGMEPTVIVGDLYALWKTDIMHFSITKTKEAHGTLKYLGFESAKNEELENSSNINTISWEKFIKEPQMQLIPSFYTNNSKIRIH